MIVLAYVLHNDAPFRDTAYGAAHLLPFTGERAPPVHGLGGRDALIGRENVLLKHERVYCARRPISDEDRLVIVFHACRMQCGSCGTITVLVYENHILGIAAIAIIITITILIFHTEVAFFDADL